MNDDLMAAALHAATAFFEEHAAQYLSRDEDQLQALCADMISARYGVSAREGLRIAQTARADMLSIGVDGFVDLERCSARMVILRDTARDCAYMLPVGRLLDLARNPA